MPKKLINKDGVPRRTQAEITKMMTDIGLFPTYCEDFMKIVPKGGGPLIPLKFRPVQRWVFEKFMMPAYMSGMPMRLIVLKARQQGFSTLFTAFNYWCATGHDNWRSLLVASDEDQAKLVFEMTHMYHNYPQRTKGYLPKLFISSMTQENMWFKRPDPRVKAYSPTEIRNSWWKNLNSTIRIKSSEKKEALGRAGTWHSVHASEVAFWPAQRRALTSLMAACHDNPETSVILETTANGMNEFFDMWQNRSVGRVDVPFDWKKIFIPWYWDDSYEVDYGTKHIFVDEEEETLFERILDDDVLWREIDPELTEDRIWNKIFWRRFTIDHKCEGDLDEFKQEYPSTDTEAFRFTGASVFSGANIARMERDICEPEWQGNIEVTPDNVDRPLGRYEKTGIHLSKKMEPFEYGRLKIYEKPQDGAVYCISADVATGKATEGISEDKSKYDFSCAQILNVSGYPPISQAAVWHGNAEPHSFAYILVGLAQFYNNAILTWEVNGIGAALKAPIINDCKYRNIYMREDWEKIGRRIVKMPGWRTTQKTKPLMVSTGVMYVSGDEIRVVDRGTLTEMKAYSRIGENKFGPSRGHDDRVMALLQNLVVIEPRIAKIKRAVQRAKDEENALQRDPDKISMVWDDDADDENPYFGNDF